MRKVKSTALLGAFVAVASVGVISHEAHGTTIGTPNNTIPIISKEILPSAVGLQASIIPNVGFTGSSDTITLKISGASFLASPSYTIVNAGCTNATQSSSTLSFTGCSVTANTAYQIASVGLSPYFSVSVPQGTSSIVLSYSSNVSGDSATSATIAQVQPQLNVTPAPAAIAYINPGSLSTFNGGSYDVYNSNSNVGLNSVSILNNAYNNNLWSIDTINPPYTINFLFTSIPSSVSSVSAFDGLTTQSGFVNTFSSATPGNGSATVSATLTGNGAPFISASSDTITFYFSNSSNVDISTGTISLSSIVGVTTGSNSYTYSSTPQNFLTFAIGGTQIYVPDALAPDNNVIQSGYITISMPSSASIASISVLNNPSASCPAPSTSNGLLTSTSSTGVYYIDLSKLAQACTGISSVAWQSGVPLVIYISGTNVDATPNNITADAYATFNGMLKRIPVDVLNISNVNTGTTFRY